MSGRWGCLSTPIIILVVLLFLNCGTSASMSDAETSIDNQISAWTSRLWTQTTALDFMAGTTTSTDVISFPGDVVLSHASSTGKTVFALVGGGRSTFYQYNMLANLWSLAPNAPGPVGDGGGITSDGLRYVYVIAGGGTSDFWRFDTYTFTWTALISTPGPITGGSSITYGGGEVWVLQGGGSTNIWYYEPVDEMWVTFLTNAPPMDPGSTITIKQSNAYIMRPGTPDFQTIPRKGGAWKVLASPSTVIGSGASLANTGGVTIYALFGNGQTSFKVYAKGSNSWTNLADTPGSVGAGGGLCYDQTSSFYALAGGGSTGFWKYTSPTWTALANVPEVVNPGGGLTFCSSSISQYATYGTFTSMVFDSGIVGGAYDSIHWSCSLTAGKTDIVLHVRASDTLVGGVPDAAWVNVGNSNYASLTGLTGRYVQIRTELTTLDTTLTPVLNEVRLYYRGF